MQNAIDYRDLQKVLREHENEFNINKDNECPTHQPHVCTVCKYLSLKPLTPYILHMNGFRMGEIQLCSECNRVISKHNIKQY